ncbi:MAG: DUF2470 domain-containing protein [Planctomycetota bacterium]|nr:DUF2470 domain-containing protein [Planctomycetota bacterium]
MSDLTVDAAHAFLRAHTTGELRFDEHLRPIRYVIAPDGRLVAPVMVAMLQSVDTVLFVPECAEGAMEVQVTLVQFDEHSPDGALADRWRIHHGDPPDVNWAFLEIDAARHEGNVIDGETLTRPNPLAGDEAGLCREMNQAHADDLRRMCREYANINIEQPVMVAIDPLGLDVRGMFDVIRVPAVEPMPTADDARRVFQAMAEAASAAGAQD